MDTSEEYSEDSSCMYPLTISWRIFPFSNFSKQTRLAGYLGTDMAGFLKVLPTILKATVELRNDELSSLNLKFNPI